MDVDTCHECKHREKAEAKAEAEEKAKVIIAFWLLTSHP